jgi:hypothetical protein
MVAEVTARRQAVADQLQVQVLTIFKPENRIDKWSSLLSGQN